MQRTAEHAALLVEVIDVELQRLQLRVAEEGGRTGDGQNGTDLDRIGGKGAECAEGQGGAGNELLDGCSSWVCLLCWNMNQTRSITMAMPCPTPMHMVHRA